MVKIRRERASVSLMNIRSVFQTVPPVFLRDLILNMHRYFTNSIFTLILMLLNFPSPDLSFIFKFFFFRIPIANWWTDPVSSNSVSVPFTSPHSIFTPLEMFIFNQEFCLTDGWGQKHLTEKKSESAPSLEASAARALALHWLKSQCL